MAKTRPVSTNPSLKDPDLYESLRNEGYSKEKAARISNAKANPDMHPSQKGGKAPPYEEWTKDELFSRAGEIGIDGRSSMTKDELIKALRNH
ncbi:Rho termination factor [Jiella sp. MQZ9-1]|uniref:Rho termination factor n=1 Tax=Jiella flava TaxID=2816857 RepID=A0A939G024_9HYPH|nr:Rho termination factor [Jiella flava]MBO0663999.1 Rho termination factor [Jiella flava]MCD2472570.1 Rho termination factor [Jiella flava]